MYVVSISFLIDFFLHLLKSCLVELDLSVVGLKHDLELLSMLLEVVHYVSEPLVFLNSFI